MRKIFKGIKVVALIAGVWYLVAGPNAVPPAASHDVDALASEISQYSSGHPHRPGDLWP